MPMPTLLETTVAQIQPLDPHLAVQAQQHLDHLTKPPGSLGRLEELARRYVAITGMVPPHIARKAVIVFAADHGVTAEGVSAYPQEVTGQMLLNFARGGAAINVLARQANARVVVVDMGIAEALPAGSAPEIRVHRIGAGTASFAHGPAMTHAQAAAALAVGAALAAELAGDGVGLIGIGDMGIGNTTASSALAAVFTGAPPEEVTGRGTGIDDETFRRKVDVIRRGLAVNRPDARDVVDALAKVGGFEIAGLAGVVLGAAAARVPVVVDGFITSVAALAAVRLAPPAAGYLIASHRSVEGGHRLVLQALGIKPLLDLELRLGEGSGAALAMPLIDAALAIAAEMATFESAGVSGASGN